MRWPAGLAYTGGMQVRITTNAIGAKYFFDRLAREQLPYAASRAVNRLAYTARDDEQNPALLGQYFRLRGSNPWLTRKGAMPVVASRKTQWPDVHAIIGVRDEVAALSITGGVRRPGLGGEMAVPLSRAGGGRSARQLLNPGTETLGPRFFPSRIVRPAPKRKGRPSGRPKPFVMKSAKGTFIVQRGAGGGLQFLYTLKRRAAVPVHWPLVNNVRLHVRRYYNPFLAKEIEAALASSLHK